MKAILLSIGVVIVSIFGFFVEENITARLAIKHMERINDEMAILRNRAKAKPSDTNALNALTLAFHSNDSWKRNAAIAYLGKVGRNAGPAVADLIEALNGDDPYDAREAATSLGEIGPGARPAVPDLIKAVQNHEDQDVGWFSAESLGRIANSNDTEVISTLMQAAKSSNELMRNNANEGLHELGITNDETPN